MTAIQRLGLLIGAAIALMAALIILLTASLPQRAAFTGELSVDQIPIAPEIHALAPDFERMTLVDETLRLSDLRGSPVILNFWATWCGPCIVEMPILQSIFEQHQAEGLHILAVNMGESRSIVQRWQDRHEFTYNLLIDEDQMVSNLYRLRGQPSTYVISPDGVITAIFFGPVTETALTAALG